MTVSPALSLFARPGDGRILGRRIALLLADGTDPAGLDHLYDALVGAGAVPRYVAARLGYVRAADGSPLPVEVTVEAAPSVLFDAVALPPGAGAAEALLRDGLAKEFVQMAYRHCKPMLVPGSAAAALQAAGIPLPADGAADPGLLVTPDGDVAGASEAFMQAIARHRAWQRQAEPSRV